MVERDINPIDPNVSMEEFFHLAEDILEDPNAEIVEAHGGCTHKYIYFMDKVAYEYLRENAQEDDNTIAFYTYKRDENGKLEDIEIVINVSAFYRNGEDYTDLIPIVIRHEVAELYHYLKNFDSESDGTSHKLAVNEEFKLALSKGKADRYMELAMIWAQELSSPRKEDFIQEHLDAYALALHNEDQKVA